nr:MAG TPA: hypothetical protein [Bacteriophage sp.]
MRYRVGHRVAVSPVFPKAGFQHLRAVCTTLFFIVRQCIPFLFGTLKCSRNLGKFSLYFFFFSHIGCRFNQ